MHVAYAHCEVRSRQAVDDAAHATAADVPHGQLSGGLPLHRRLLLHLLCGLLLLLCSRLLLQRRRLGLRLRQRGWRRQLRLRWCLLCRGRRRRCCCAQRRRGNCARRWRERLQPGLLHSVLRRRQVKVQVPCAGLRDAARHARVGASRVASLAMLLALHEKQRRGMTSRMQLTRRCG